MATCQDNLRKSSPNRKKSHVDWSANFLIKKKKLPNTELRFVCTQSLTRILMPFYSNGGEFGSGPIAVDSDSHSNVKIRK